MSHTLEQTEWLKRRQAVKDGKQNALTHFKNLALDNDGDLMIGMTYNFALSRYSCTYTQRDGVRDFGGARSWDNQGGSLDGLADLNLGTVNSDVRVI